MSFDFEARQHKYEQAKRQKEARDAYTESLSAQQLANELLKTLAIDPDSHLPERADILDSHVRLLDRTFIAMLHKSGLGETHRLRSDPLQSAMMAQRLCRQTVETLHRLETFQAPSHEQAVFANEKKDTESVNKNNGL